MLKNSNESYGPITKILHCLSAVVIFALFSLGFWMVELDYEHDWYDTSFHYHESIGILFSILIFLRLIWNYYNPKPKPTKKLLPIERKTAYVVHTLLYLFCIFIVITGYLIPTADTRGITVFTWFTVPSIGSFHHQQADIAGKLHYWFSYGLMALVALHVLAACKHHFIDKDKSLKRMF